MDFNHKLTTPDIITKAKLKVLYKAYVRSIKRLFVYKWGTYPDGLKDMKVEAVCTILRSVLLS